MKTSRQQWALFTSLLVTLAGCGQFAPGNSTATQAQPAGQTPSGGPATQAAPDDGAPPEGTFIRGLGDAIPPFPGTERNNMQRNLRDADDSFTRIKRDNLEALRQANRQVRIRGIHSPNIILIVADDLGYGDLGSYGQTRIQTPVLDALAARGARFTNFYAGSPLDAPSAWTLMTGLHTGRARGRESFDLQAQDCTLAEVLWQAGYTTAIIGNATLGGASPTSEPTEHGFEHWFGYRERPEMWDHFPEFLWCNGVEVRLPENADGARERYANDVFTQQAISFLSPERCKRPFFLCLAYTVPHVPLEVPSDEPYSDEDWPQPQKNYAAMITRMDGDINRILRRLDELRIGGNTVIFFTSDNGPSRAGDADPDFFDSAGPLRGAKGELFDGGIRVPLIVFGPGHVQPATVTDHVGAFWDFLPTMAQLVGAIHWPRNVDGISFLPTIGRGHARSGVQGEHEYLYWELPRDGQFDQAVRTENWKAIRPAGQAVQLYDLETDIGETTDVAADFPEVVEKVERFMREATGG